MLSALRKGIEAILDFLRRLFGQEPEDGIPGGDGMADGKVLTAEQIRQVADQTLEMLAELIASTDLPKLREEDEAVVVGQLGPVIFAELAALEKSQE